MPTAAEVSQRRQVTGDFSTTGGDTSAPTVRKNGPSTARKSQSMSTKEWTTQSATASDSASHTRVRSRRSTAITPAAITPTYNRNPTIPVSLRNWSGTECGSVVASCVSRSSRSVSSNVPAPVPFSGFAVNAFQASVHQRQRLLELVLITLPGVSGTCELTLFENSCQRALTKSPGPPARTTAATTATSNKTTRATAAPRATRASTARSSTNRVAKTTTIPPTISTAPNTSPSCRRA